MPPAFQHLSQHLGAIDPQETAFKKLLKTLDPPPPEKCTQLQIFTVNVLGFINLFKSSWAKKQETPYSPVDLKSISASQVIQLVMVLVRK